MPRNRKQNRTKKYHELRKRKRNINSKKDRKTYDSTRYSHNRLFTEYYLAQQICDSEDDFKKFTSCLGTDLPATIRIYPNAIFAKRILDNIEKYRNFLSKKKILVKDKVYQGPTNIAWYPEQNSLQVAWRLGTDRLTLRKNSELSELHKFLVRESKTQNITRQEEVSMIPVVLLNIKSDSRVFDACAAPGSKTAQIIEMLHKKNSDVSGYLVANDADPRRAYMLHHQLKRFKSPNLLVTGMDAQLFPEFKGLFSDEKNIFDRILCDVPCSGDGTLRKNCDIWRTFDPNHALNLHKLQIMIAWKCLKLLEIGGLMVYSTCSFNPVENEAVIAQLLRLSKGSLEIVPRTGELKNLKCRPGLSKWKVGVKLSPTEKIPGQNGNDGAPLGSSLMFFDTLSDFNKFRSKHPLKKGKIKFSKQLYESMFSSEMKSNTLENCIRILPQDQDTGGFFVCLLRKTGELSRWEGDLLSKSENNTYKVNPSVNNKDKKPTFKEKNDKEPISKRKEVDVFALVGDKQWTNVCNELDFTVKKEHQIIYRVPRETTEQYEPKVLNYTSKSIVETFLNTVLQQRLNIIACGIPIIKKSDRKIKGQPQAYSYRLANDGLNVTAPWLVNNNSSRVLKLSLKDFMLFCSYSLYEPVSEKAKAGKNFCPGVPIDILEEKEAIQDLFTGCYLLVLTEEDQCLFFKEFNSSLRISLWKSKKTLSQLINRHELDMIFCHLNEAKLINYKRIQEQTIEDYYISMLEIKLRQEENLID